jgi:hypothetical protein
MNCDPPWPHRNTKIDTENQRKAGCVWGYCLVFHDQCMEIWVIQPKMLTVMARWKNYLKGDSLLVPICKTYKFGPGGRGLKVNVRQRCPC